MDRTAKIKLREVGPGACGPLLATFLQGPPPPSSLFPPLEEGGAGERDLQFVFSVDSRRRGRLAGSSESGIEYSARSTDTAAAAAGYKYLVGVVNKRGRLSLAPVETGGVFKLELTTTHAGATSSGPKSDRARQALLINDFGSRKKKKMEVSRQANIVDVRAVAAAGEVGQHLQASSAGRVGASEESTADGAPGAGTAGSKLAATLHAGRVATLPPFDAAAETPEGAYPLGGIISESVFEALEPSVRLVVKAMEGGDPAAQETAALVEQLSFGSQHVADRLHALLRLRVQRKRSAGGEAAAEDGAIRRSAAKTRAGCLVFLAQLLLLHRAPNSLHFRLPPPPPPGAEGGVAGAEMADVAAASPAAEPAIPALAGVPAAVVSELLARFTEARPAVGAGAAAHPSFYVRGDELRDRLIAHAAVLALITDGFALDVSLLARDLRLPLAKVATFLREAGAGVEPVRDGGAVVSYTATLKAPLVFPKLKYGRR